MKFPKPETVAVWTLLISASKTLLEDIEDTLKREGLPSLSWYDALLEIEKAGAIGIRPFELKERLLLPQYGLSRLLDRVSKAGMIDRQEVEADGRGQLITLTRKGHDARKAMWPVYANVLTQAIEQQFTQAETLEFARLLKKLTHDADMGRDEH